MSMTPDAFRWDGNYLVYDGPETAHRGMMCRTIRGILTGPPWPRRRGVCHAAGGLPGLHRGASTSLDATFYDNVAGARENGIAVGVYFFSQAINEEEARRKRISSCGPLRAWILPIPLCLTGRMWASLMPAPPHDQQQLTDCAKRSVRKSKPLDIRPVSILIRFSDTSGLCCRN